MKNRSIGIHLLLVACCFGASAVYAVPKNNPLSNVNANIQGRGLWKAESKEPRSQQKWNLQVKRNTDNSLRGRITIEGSPWANGGSVDGHVFNDSVLGTITDDLGNTVATFQGTISDAGISGTYTDIMGEVGEWSWQGSLAK